MVQVESRTLRVRFQKIGRLQYISHLDLVRTVMKVLVRSGLPLKYTEGFNPKPKLSFAAPLPTGAQSVCELMDIKLAAYIDTDEALEMLNKNLTDELRATEAYYPDTKFTELAYLSYKIVVNTVGKSRELADRINEFLSDETLPILKKTKSGEREVDIKPQIKEAKATFDGENIVIDCLLSSSPSAFLSPELFVRLLKDGVGILTSPNLMSESYSIMRTEAYLSDMSLFR